MGGLFSSPTPPPPPSLPEPENPEANERDRRLEALDRRRRGRGGTIHTSFQGVLSDTLNAQDPVDGKTLLGE